MRTWMHIVVLVLSFFSFHRAAAQSSSPAPYCSGTYGQGVCLQGSNQTNNPNNSVNDFIDFFRTTGGSTNITNDSSGCNMNPNNYALYCSQFLATTQGQTITCTMKSGITFGQGFAIFVDWNQDNTFQVPGERIAATSNVPAPATWTTLVFVIPNNIPNGIYRMRVRCAFATAGTAITPCGASSYGETEDYTIVVGNVPITCNVITATATANSPLCAGATLSLGVVTNSCSGLTYTWTGPGNFSVNTQNTTRANLTPTMSGTYSVTVSNSMCPVTKTVAVVVTPYPNYNLTPATPTICQGGNFVGTATFVTGNPNQFSFQWAPTSGAGFIFSQYAPSTSITPLPLPVNLTVATVVYSITVSPTVNPSCSVKKTLTVTIHNPTSPTLTMPAPVCNNFAPVSFTAVPGGGAWSGHFAVNPAGLLTPVLINTFGSHTVMYTAQVGNCKVSTTGTFNVSKFNTSALASTLNLVCEQDQGHQLMNLVQNTVTGSWSGFGVSNNVFIPGGLATGNYTAKYKTYSLPDSTVCPDSTYLSIPVFHPPVPVISQVGPRCTNAPTIAMQANPAGGSWNNSSAVSVAGVLTPSLGQPGTNQVSYTAGQGTCVASSTTSFHISQFRPATITGTVPHLCVSFQPVNLMGIVQSTTGTWSGTNVIGNSFYPAGLQTKIYKLRYLNRSFPDPLLCPDSSDIMASVLNPPTPEITIPGALCSRDGTVQLTAKPATGKWTSNYYLNADGVFKPTLAAAGNNPVQYVIGTNTCFAQQTKFISVESFVPAILTTNRLPDQCVNNLAVNLSPLAPGSVGSWSGTAVAGSNFDPAVAGAGNFTLTYHTASYPSGLCPDQAALTVHVFTLAPPVIDRAGPFCSKAAPVQLVVSPVGGIFRGSNTWAVSAQGHFDPANAIAGENVISYSISSGPCISHAQTTISVEKFVSAALSSQPVEAVCRNSQPFDLNSLVYNTGGRWSGDAVTGSMFDPAKGKAGQGNLLVYRTQSFPDALCADSAAISIRVDEIPAINIFSHVTRSCTPVQVIFNMPNANKGTGKWILGDGTTSDSLRTTHIYRSPGSYSVVFNYTLGACSTQAQLSTPVTVVESPGADFIFSKEELSISDPDVELLNRSSVAGNNRYLWTVEGVGEYSDVNPAVSFPGIGDYRVTLRATSLSGCSHEVTKTISVKNEFYVFIPNSFTPNFDGMNDVFIPVFSPYGLDAKNYELKVFDRWGHLVFASTDPGKGWDGTLQNKGDTPLKQETYVYILKYNDAEGTRYERSGSVILLKP